MSWKRTQFIMSLTTTSVIVAAAVTVTCPCVMADAPAVKPVSFPLLHRSVVQHFRHSCKIVTLVNNTVDMAPTDVRFRRREVWTNGSRLIARCSEQKEKGQFLLAQYPVLRTAHSALHFTSLTDLFNQTLSQLLRETSSHMPQLMRDNCSFTYPPPSIAKYSFLVLWTCRSLNKCNTHAHAHTHTHTRTNTHTHTHTHARTHARARAHTHTYAEGHDNLIITLNLFSYQCVILDCSCPGENINLVIRLNLFDNRNLFFMV